MKTPTMRQMGLTALLTCGLVLFMPNNTFAQGGGGGGHGGGKGGHRGGPGERGGPGGQNAAGGDQGQNRAGGPGGMGAGDGPGAQSGMRTGAGPGSPSGSGGPGEMRPGGPDNRDPGVNRREHNQEGRIGQGVRSGQLTKEEAQGLAATQKEIRQEEKAYKSDGVLTKDERKDLHQDLNAASKEIYSEKHDAETQPGVKPAEPKPLGTKDPGVNSRQANQEQRIKQGVQSGELTKREAHTLAEKEAHLAVMENRLKADGNLSAEDRARLQHRLDYLNREIAREKHDGQKATTTP